MCEGAEQSPWAVPRLLDVIALGGLVYLRVELLLRARMAVPARVTSFTIARLAPLLSVLYVWTWCATILIFSWWSTFILEKKMHVFFCLQNSICLHVTKQLLWALKEIQMSCDFSVCSFIKILSVLQHNSSLFCFVLQTVMYSVCIIQFKKYICKLRYFEWIFTLFWLIKTIFHTPSISIKIHFRYVRKILTLLLWYCGHAYPCLHNLGGLLHGSVLYDDST